MPLIIRKRHYGFDVLYSQAGKEDTFSVEFTSPSHNKFPDMVLTTSWNSLPAVRAKVGH